MEWLLEYYAWVKPACSLVSKGLNWHFLRFSGGILWMQRPIPAVARPGGNTDHVGLKLTLVLWLPAFINTHLQMWMDLQSWYLTNSLNNQVWTNIKYILLGDMNIDLLKYLWSKKLLLLIWKAFQSKDEWRFPFWNNFFRFRDIRVFLLCKWGKWWCHK